MVTPIQIDVTDNSSVDNAAKIVQDRFGYLDVLINNAGIGSQQHSLTARDAMRQVLEVNVVGVVGVTEALIPLLRTSTVPRLIFVSTTGTISCAADPTSPLHGGGAIDYRSSKAALNMLMDLYSNRLESEVFKAFGANPGLIVTNFHGGTRRPGAEPEVGGERIAAAVRGDWYAEVGKVVGAHGVLLPW